MSALPSPAQLQQAWEDLREIRRTHPVVRDVKIPRAGKYSESQTAMRTSFGGRCAAYGTRENQPDPRYGGDPVVLQPGRKDPAKAGDERANIVPQRQFRNRGYKDDFTFDDRG